MKPFFLVIITLIILNGCSKTPSAPLATVDHVDLTRYSGAWIEIARYENRFETGCAGATAHYASKEDYIAVTNRCFDTNGIQSGEANGRAYTLQDSNNSKLKVSFFRPFYGDYWVLMLGDNYQYSVVGDPSRKYLWILSRTKVLSDADKKSILNRLPALGYDPNRLYWTTQQP
ncbi:MAG: lipocalin family protein [Sulfurimonas sp.]|jgi:apolipoprotein D and lipocalin family protein